VHLRAVLLEIGGRRWRALEQPAHGGVAGRALERQHVERGRGRRRLPGGLFGGLRGGPETGTIAHRATLTHRGEYVVIVAEKKVKREVYEARLEALQLELVKLQYWIKQEGLKLVVVFEGRDAAGKGGTIKRLTEPLNPRGATVVALPAPTEREQTQWYFQRYVAHLPAAGEIVIFDRSWYNRGGVEKVLGFCTKAQHREWLRSCPEFEQMLVRSGIVLLKYWFSVSDDEQERRFQERAQDPLKRWKLSPMDLKSREKWVEFSKAKDEMFAVTDIPEAPWFTIESDDKRTARLNCISHVLEQIPYKNALPGPIDLPPRPEQDSYKRPPKDQHRVIDQDFWAQQAE
jgi:polyphosphate kinase 2